MYHTVDSYYLLFLYGISMLSYVLAYNVTTHKCATLKLEKSKNQTIPCDQALGDCREQELPNLVKKSLVDYVYIVTTCLFLLNGATFLSNIHLRVGQQH